MHLLSFLVESDVVLTEFDAPRDGRLQFSPLVAERLEFLRRGRRHFGFGARLRQLLGRRRQRVHVRPLQLLQTTSRQ